MLRRGYSYDEGWDAASGTADAGLFFLGYVRDLRAQFVPVQRALADGDRLSRFTTTVGSAVFAIPPGATSSGYVGDTLLD
jgi:deferrochelatase/peroxidase EfeB